MMAQQVAAYLRIAAYHAEKGDYARADHVAMVLQNVIVARRGEFESRDVDAMLDCVAEARWLYNQHTMH